MAIHKLNALKLAKLTKPGPALLGDGGGLYLRIAPGGSKSWLFRYMLAGKAKSVPLGRYPDVSLAEARVKAVELRQQKVEGTDPRNERRRRIQREANAKTFKEAAEAYIHSREGDMKPHSLNVVRNSLGWVDPILGHVPITEVDTDLVFKALDRIWKKYTSASKARVYIASVLDFAVDCGWRPEGVNPASYRKLKRRLPDPEIIHGKPESRPALHYDDVYLLVQKLWAHRFINWDGSPSQVPRQGRASVFPYNRGVVASLLVILTGLRKGTVLSTHWSEIDLERGVWIRPGRKMKGRLNKTPDFYLPISDAVAELLNSLPRIPNEDRLFPSARASESGYFTHSRALEDAGYSKTEISDERYADGQRKRKKINILATDHGFRSTIRTWATKQRRYDADVIESVLAHEGAFKLSSNVSADVQRAYNRDPYLMDERFKLYQDWGRHCFTPPAAEAENVLRFQIPEGKNSLRRKNA